MIIIRQANTDEYDAVEKFYSELINAMRGSEFRPDWEMGVYPKRRQLEDAIITKTLYLAFLENEPAAAMILNHDCEPEYDGVKWQTDAKREEIMIIHLLGVSPAHQGKGVARRMVSYVIDLCEKNSIKAIRLDVLKKNTPAARLYASMGFQYIDSVKIYYEDTGLTDFLLYEFLIH